MKFKKTIGPVVATALLLIVAIVSVVGFQGWFNDYSSSTFTDVETQSSIDSNLKVEGLIGDILYLKSGNDINLSLLKVVDDSGIEMCSFSGSTDVNSSGLVGWWTFDEIINNSGTLILPDYSELGNDGILYDANISNSDGNTTPQLVKSKLGNALEFDGVDDYVEVLDDDSLDLDKNISIFVNLVINFNDYSGDVIFDKRNVTLKSDFHISFNEYFKFGYRNTDFHQYESNKKTFLNRYFSKFISYSSGINSSAKIYINNFDVGGSWIYGYGNRTLTSNNNSLLFGTGISNSNELDRFSNIKIDEIRIYNRTLSDDEIKTLYWYSIRPQQIGINQIDLSSCNLNKGEKYNIVAFTYNNKVEHIIISK